MSKQIELMGHMAIIDRIIGRPADPRSLYLEDELQVWLNLEKDPFKSLIGFGISIPVKEYTPDDFLKIVKSEGERYLKNHTLGNEKDRIIRTQIEDKKKSLDALASRIIDSLG